ncbi:FMN-binding negative transcriptional regulator [Tessaracoccus antarcticus]|uniref:FMN-binding negative transcriptional regulator n=1 Tax=Tessaracoccus antarcticus TaxID=2479848 RepID=A0A3M0GF98_9ACTN|nr:FMN-binding negative transcriptional regulator [Tessaracoccus antarcticus]RMB61342.1 FMN-binding negative transcriptional regulator [Tessaracoccus antarcticus]
MDPVPLSRVYCPASQRVDDWEQCRALLDDVGAASWITGGHGVPNVTLLPTMWRGSLLLAHAAAHNLQFDLPEATPVPCRVVVQGPHTYVTPRWYPSVQPPDLGGSARGRAEFRGVGTWDYTQVQVAGWLRVHRDRDRLRTEVMDQAEQLDAARLVETPHVGDAVRGPWNRDEAPHDFTDAMLQGIVGLELEITDVVGRFKVSRNRTAVDRDGVVQGLRERGRDRDHRVADEVAAAPPLPRGVQGPSTP